MGNVPPEYCHYCGGALEAVQPPTAHRCPDCNEWVFYNPIPRCGWPSWTGMTSSS
jgi:DNA-directed RNA polymerase subunit RPC12/RpoP